MKANDILIAKILTYSGTIPFFICITLLFYVPIKNIDSIYLALTYGTTIISFLCGIHWGIYLFSSKKFSLNLLIISNIITLINWFLLIFKIIPFTFIVQSICFIILLLIDKKLYNEEILPKWFYQLRLNATLIVLLCLTITTYIS